MPRTHVSPLKALATIAMAASLMLPLTARAHVELGATLDSAQEVPPVSTPSTATGTATLLLEEDGSLTGEVSVQNLTGAPILAHIHQGPAGTAGPPLFTLDHSSISGTSGIITVATAPLTDAQQQTLFAGGLYVNVHTPANGGGEARGQITMVPGRCDCETLSSAQFKQCVRRAIKGLDSAEKKDEAIKALKKAFKVASCGRAKAKKKAIACCLSLNPEENIVTDALCGVVPEKKCTSLGGTSKGAGSSCIPTNPCGSPSGAFLE